MRIERTIKRYGEKTALSVEALAFRYGEICAVMGENGSGKTTLARIAADVLKPDAGGRVLEKGETIGYMPQKSYAFYGTLARNVALGSPAGRFDERCHELVSKLGLSSLERAKAKALSGGETARMALARVLAGTWSFLVLDEPTAALDIPSTLAAEQLLKAYRDETGAGMLVVTHSVSQARRLADRIVFLSGGVVVEDGPTEQSLAHPSTPEFAQFLAFLGA